jgi:hypothetical protein
MARPRRTLPNDGAQIIRSLASRGPCETQIAAALGVDFKTWKRIHTQDPVARDALEEARLIEQETLVGELINQATTEKSTAAAMFLLVNRHGYRPSDASTQDAKVTA